jgi:hypothetical protein
LNLNITFGDFLFCEWDKFGWKHFKGIEHHLRMLGFRKVERSFDDLNMFVTYKRKKKRITITMLLS